MIEYIMNYFLLILEWYDSLHTFFQSLVAAGIIGAISFLLRFIASKARKSGSEFFADYQKMDMFKHMAHKKLVNSENIILVAHGYFLITLQAFRWVFRGVLLLVFILCVRALVENDWWLLIGLWVLLNSLFEASTWLKDKSSEKEISYIKPEIKDAFYKEFFPQEGVAESEPNKLINRTENTSVQN